MQIKINSLVSQVWENTLRLGIVKDRTVMEDGWAYLEIDWFQDYEYKAARSSALLNNHRFKDGDHYGLYRVDHVQEIDLWKVIGFCEKYLSKEINSY